MAGFALYPKRKMRKLLREGEYTDAIKFGKTIEPKFVDDHDFMFIMGSAYFIVEDAKNAVKYFERALELDNNDTETLMLKTNAHLALGQKDGAISSIDRILELEPKNDEALNLLEKLHD